MELWKTRRRCAAVGNACSRPMFSNFEDCDNWQVVQAAHGSRAGPQRLSDGFCWVQQVVEIKPDWPKGYSRLGGALAGLQQWDEAKAAYEKGGGQFRIQCRGTWLCWRGSMLSARCMHQRFCVREIYRI